MEHKADDIGEIVRVLRSNEPLPVCPYDRRSPDYFTAPVDKPCVVCGTINDPDAPDLCRGADTRVMKKAADALERLSAERSALQDELQREANKAEQADYRAEAAEAALPALVKALEKIACDHVTENPLWWQLEARAALASKQVERMSGEIKRLRAQLASARKAAIEECAKVAEEYPSSGAATERPVEYWIRQLSFTDDQREVSK